MQNEVKAQSEVIFGTDDENSDEGKAKRTQIIKFYKTRKVQIGIQTVVSTDSDGNQIETKIPIYKDETYEDESLRQQKSWGAGEYGSHIGYDPVLKENPNVDDGLEGIWQDKGMGELGRLMRSYIYWSMRESQGWAMVNKPVWDKPTWDDRGSWFKAPTIRGMTDIAVTIGANVLFPGGGLAMLAANAALNLADDAVFAALDVGGCYKSCEQAGLDFGKKALTSAVNIGVGQLYAPVMTAVSASPGVGGVIGSTLVSGTQTFTTSTLNSAVNAFELTYNEDGKITGLGWSQNAFNAGVQGGLISAATGMTSSLTSGLLNNWNAGEKLFGFSQKNQQDVYKLNQTIGSLAGQGVNYALTGDFALNVLSLSDLTGGALKGGLLELHVGKNGATMNVGMGGADVSLGTIASAMGGLAVVDVNRRIGTYVKQSGKDLAVLLRSQYGFGDAVQKGQIWEILAGDTLIAEGGVDKENAAAQTKREGDKRVVHLAGYRDGMSKAEQLALGITLAHEAYRNGLDDGEAGQLLETNRAVEGHIAFAAALAKTYGMGAIGETMAKEVAAYTKAQSGDRSELETILSDYDASKDYWRLTKDGNLAYDGKANLYDENGVLIRETKSQGIEGSMLEILGLADNAKNRAAVVAMMKSSGLEQDTKGKWLGEDVSVNRRIPFGGIPGFYLANHVNLTAANMGKEISLYSIDSLFTSLGVGKETYQNFIEKNYISAIGYTTRVSGQTNQKWAQSIYNKAYSADERSRIQANTTLLQTIMSQGIDYSKVVPGASRTTEFGVDVTVSLATSSVAGAVSFFEEHTGFDYGAGGTGVYTPGGFWQVVEAKDHKLYLQLYGTDVKMRIMHLDPAKVDDVTLGQIIGSANGNVKIIDYPTASFGSGSGPHTHIDFTRSFAGATSYYRSFVNPSNWSNGSQLEYQYIYYGANGSPLAGYPKNFNRY